MKAAQKTARNTFAQRQETLLSLFGITPHLSSRDPVPHSSCAHRSFSPTGSHPNPYIPLPPSPTYLHTIARLVYLALLWSFRSTNALLHVLTISLVARSIHMLDFRSFVSLSQPVLMQISYSAFVGFTLNNENLERLPVPSIFTVNPQRTVLAKHPPH